MMKKLGSLHENLDFKIYQELKSMILERKLKPGDKLYQDRIARDFGVSRTPLMCALKKLEQEKLIQAIPRRGFFVRKFSKEEIIHIFELREVLEGLAARRAAIHGTTVQLQKIKSFFKQFKNLYEEIDVKQYSDEDQSFHNYITQVGGLDLLQSIVRNYNIITFSYRLDFMEGLIRHPRETMGEHLAIIDAILSRQPEKAEEEMRNHLKWSRQRLAEDDKKTR
ncbi:MAG: GntR family transcriptional regulator [Deltaproteobacteria bacterium]|nr:GntR family transcriptional regulator [Deltaproteobacteria bacterium]